MQGTLCRLSALRLTVSHPYYYKRMDEYGKDFAASVLGKVRKETQRLKKQHKLSTATPSTESPSSQHPPPLPARTPSVVLAPATPATESPSSQHPPPPPACTPSVVLAPATPATESPSSQHPPPPPAPSVMLAPDKGRKLVFDNFDFKQRVHNMTESHQNFDIHWVTHMAVENRVSGNHLPRVKPSTDDLLQLENGLCLPSRHEHHLQRENYLTLAERAIAELPCFGFLKSVVCKHIPHQYSKQMSEKSEIVRETLQPLNKYIVVIWLDMMDM